MSDQEYDDYNEAEPAYEAPAEAKKSTAKRRKKKDPAKPKGAKSAYMFFSSAVRPELQQQNPEKSMTELAKVIGAKWSELTTEAKEPYAKMAAEDKIRYQKEMEDYVPAEEYQEKETGATSKKKAKKVKDPNAPKRPMSAFFVFSGERREKVKEENPDFAAKDVARRLGEEWAALDEEGKKPYTDKAAELKATYEIAKKEYDEKKKAEAAA
eukprot:TRINITY_DN9201_c0_g1_i2.p1 TRINITY_DN9201_c0_g1~~TRINITY_DN9201_c0_g1_i2.p1  ORF type:complete len:211 (+),score=81.21 TRINITY_DN9201_c0_g1_i2:47-679(+)